MTKYEEAKQNAEAAHQVYLNFVDMAEDKLASGEIQEWPQSQMDMLWEKYQSMKRIADELYWEMDEHKKRILCVSRNGELEVA